eukprot:gene30580-35598_t
MLATQYARDKVTSRVSKIATLMCQGMFHGGRCALAGADLATSVWALGRLGYAPPGMVSLMLRELLSNSSSKFSELASDTSASGLAQRAPPAASRSRKGNLLVMYGGALSLSFPQKMLQSGGPPSQRLLSEFSQLGPQSGSNPKWKQPKQAPTLVPSETLERAWSTLGHLATRNAWNANGDDVARLAWAFAKSQHHTTALFDALAERVVQIFIKDGPSMTPLSPEADQAASAAGRLPRANGALISLAKESRPSQQHALSSGSGAAPKQGPGADAPVTAEAVVSATSAVAKSVGALSFQQERQQQKHHLAALMSATSEVAESVGTIWFQQEHQKQKVVAVQLVQLVVKGFHAVHLW